MKYTGINVKSLVSFAASEYLSSNAPLFQGPVGIKGDKGDRGEKGDRGLKGEKFNYTDFTTAQLADLIGPKGVEGERGIGIKSIEYHDSVDEATGAIIYIRNRPGYSDGFHIELEDGTTPMFFRVYNGRDGLGAPNDAIISTESTWSSYKINEELVLKQDLSEKSQPEGYASLDINGFVPLAELPPEVFNVLTYDDDSLFPVTGQDNTIYIDKSTEYSYRWDDTTSSYVKLTGTSWGEIDGVLSNQVDLQLALDSKEDIAMKGLANGYASLNASGTVPASQLPSYVDDVIEVATYADLLLVSGESDKIYIVINDETENGSVSTYRWVSGTNFALISNLLNASDIKSLYEINADTNAYTDEAKTKVDLISVTDVIDLDEIKARATVSASSILSLADVISSAATWVDNEQYALTRLPDSTFQFDKVQGGHILHDSGTPFAQRTKLDFTGNGVTVTDDDVNDFTIVNIPNGYAEGNTIPSMPEIGDEWLDTNDGTLYKFVSDGTNTAWIDIGGIGVVPTIGWNTLT